MTERMMMFVVGQHVIDIELDGRDAPHSLSVTARVDGDRRWSSEEPGWRELGVGTNGTVPYLWSARRLVVLGVDAGEQSEVFDVDEDIVTVFWVREGWLVVCETSVRLLSSRGEASRLELPDVVLSARWVGAGLELQHPAARTRVGMADGRLRVL